MVATVSQECRRDQDGEKYVVRQCPLDPCIFMFQKPGRNQKGETFLNPPELYLAVHVDHVLLIGQDSRTSVENVKEALSLNGRRIVSSTLVGVSQSAYVETRLFQVEVPAYMKDDDPATEEQCHDNRSLAWLASRIGRIFKPGCQCVSSCRRSRRLEI